MFVRTHHTQPEQWHFWRRGQDTVRLDRIRFDLMGYVLAYVLAFHANW